MKIVAMYLIFLRVIDLSRSQRESGIAETRVVGDSEWSRKTGNIDGVAARSVTLEDEDENARRWEPERAIRDPRRRPRPFSNPPSRETFRHPIADEPSRGKKFRDDDDHVGFGAFELAGHPVEPSPILLPPFATPSPVYRVSDVLGDTAIASESRNDSSSGKSSASSAHGRIRIYEITKFNETGSGANLEANPVVDSKSSDAKEEKSPWTDFPRFVNETARENYGIERGKQSLDHTPVFRVNGKTVRAKSPRNKSRAKNLRGARKYQDYPARKKAIVVLKNGIFAGSSGYEWRESSERRTDRFIDNDDTNLEVGSVPGVPGRDYPIHQEHTHHHLRNVVDRFPCPLMPKSHVYLADRASRCQIFYVCYGSKTGVPMVCPNGTLFSELLQVCDWWYNVVC